MKTQKRRRSRDEAAILDTLKIITIRPWKRWQNTDRPCLLPTPVSPNRLTPRCQPWDRSPRLAASPFPGTM